MSKLTVLSQYFYPSPSATSQLLTDLSRGLAEKGVELDVYTAIQAEKSIEESGSFQETDHLSGLQVHRSYCPVQSGTSILSKLLSSFFFMFGAAVFLLFQQPKETPVLIASNPPYAGLLGILFRQFRGGSYTYLLQDIFPESAVMAGMLPTEGPVRRFADWMSFQICQQAAQTIVLSPSMREFLQCKYPQLTSPIQIIENWAIADIPSCLKPENLFAKEQQLTDKFVVLYSGNIGRLHDIETIVETAKILNHEAIEFVFIGSGSKIQIIQQAIAEGYSNLRLLPFQPRERLEQTLTACDIALVSLIPGAESIIAPSKLYGILSAGRTVLSISAPGSDLDNLVRDHSCGINVSNAQPLLLAQTILDLSKNIELVNTMGKNARKLYEKHYRFERAFEEYKALLFENMTCDNTQKLSAIDA